MITIAKCLLECREGRLASAVARCHEGHIEGIAQSRDYFLDLWSLDTTRWKPPAMKWIRGLIAAAATTILSMPGLRAAHHDHYAVGRVDRERQLAQLQNR